MMPTTLTAARTTAERLRPFTRLQSGATTLAAAERPAENAKLAGDDHGVATFGEELQDAEHLLGERLDRRVMGRVAGERDELSGNLHHTVEPFLITPTQVDVALQPHEEPPSRALVVEDDR